jgi:uncharacterized membrane protein YagU involved in acid resistance
VKARLAEHAVVGVDSATLAAVGDRLNNATHWGFGLATGAGFGFLLGSRRRPKVWYGLPFGAAVWAGGYSVLPQLGVYKPIWEYDLGTLRKDLTAHLVVGTATAAAFDLLTRGETGREGSGNS